jgi:hypothetical protein
MKPKLSEHAIQKQILDWLKIKDIFHWRNNSGAMGGTRKGKRWFMRFGAVGSPDIFAVVDGKIYGIEVKSKGNKMSDNQVIFSIGLQNSGGIYVLAYKLEDVTDVLTRL